MDIRKIYEGWRNRLIPPAKLKEMIKYVSNHRTSICEACEHHSSNTEHDTYRFDKHCTVCGCTISAKTSCLSCKCPLPSPKWDAVLTEEQEEEIEKYENKENTGE